MQRRDKFDIVLLAALVAVIGFLVVFAIGGQGQGPKSGKPDIDRALERQVAYQARVAFLEDLYRPVLELRSEGKSQQALLKLEEIARQYPGEAHGLVLRAALLQDLGVLDKAIASYVEAVRANGDYVDANSPLSRRTEIRQLVDEGLGLYRERVREHEDNPTFVAALKNLYYLQSRLAGGCE